MLIQSGTIMSQIAIPNSAALITNLSIPASIRLILGVAVFSFINLYALKWISSGIGNRFFDC